MNEAGGGSIAYVKVWTTAVSLPESSTPLLPPVALKAIVLSSTTVVLHWTDSTISKNQVSVNEKAIFFFFFKKNNFFTNIHFYINYLILITAYVCLVVK